VSLARSDNLPFWSFEVNPFVPRVTMNPRMDFSSASPFVLAQTTAMCAVDPLVIHILPPFSTHEPSFCSRAIVIMPDGLDP
jgi:hypothetical protein